MVLYGSCVVVKRMVMKKMVVVYCNNSAGLVDG